MSTVILSPEYNGCPKPNAVGIPEDSGYDLWTFPIHPPKPSDFEILPTAYFRNLNSLEDVNSRLFKALDDEGYTPLEYFHLSDGFAVITELKQTDSDGIPLSDNSRWMKTKSKKYYFSLKNYFEALFIAQKGYYRCFVFVVNSSPITFSTNTVEPEHTITDLWMAKAATILPEKIGKKPFASKYRITVLIYQFEKAENNSEINLIQKTNIPGQHLTRSVIKQNLQP